MMFQYETGKLSRVSSSIPPNNLLDMDEGKVGSVFLFLRSYTVKPTTTTLT
jgi:hypothetical protein